MNQLARSLTTVPLLLMNLSGCSRPVIKGYEGPNALNQAQVIEGARSCINTRMKPHVVYLPQETDFGSILVPVDVQCNPYR